MTQPDINTNGGAYVGGDIKAEKMAGRDLIINGVSADEYMHLLAQVQREKDDAIQTMQSAIHSSQALKAVLIAGRATWQGAYGQIDRIGFAKEIHDLLQRLALAYNLLHPLLFEHNSLRPASEWRWVDVRRHCTLLKGGLRNLFRTISERQANIDDLRESWMSELQQCGVDLDEALAHQNADLLDQGLTTIRTIIDTQPTRYNARLGEAVDAMDTPRLFRTLSEMGTSIAALRSPTNPSLDVFLGFVSVIYQQIHELTHLRNVHHSWQDIEDRLQMEYAQLHSDPNRFRLQWQRRLAPRLHDVLAADSEQASEVQSCVDALEASFVSGNLVEVRDALWNLRSTVSQRFNEVDYDFKRLCSALDKNSHPLGETIAGLN